MVETIRGNGMKHAVLPFPPSANRYWRMVYSKSPKAKTPARMIKSQEARDYIENARIEAYRQSGQEATSNPVVFLANIYFPNKRGDLDNRLKVVIDSLNGIMYDDDKQIVEIHVKRMTDKENPRIEVWVEEQE